MTDYSAGTCIIPVRWHSAPPPSKDSFCQWQTVRVRTVPVYTGSLRVLMGWSMMNDALILVGRFRVFGHTLAIEKVDRPPLYLYSTGTGTCSMRLLRYRVHTVRVQWRYPSRLKKYHVIQYCGYRYSCTEYLDFSFYSLNFITFSGPFLLFVFY